MVSCNLNRSDSIPSTKVIRRRLVTERITNIGPKFNIDGID